MRSRVSSPGAISVFEALLLTAAVTFFPGPIRAESVLDENNKRFYLEAVDMIKAGRPSIGAAMLESLDSAEFILGDYAAYDLAKLAYESGDYSAALGYVDGFGAKFPNSPLVNEINRIELFAACADIVSPACGKALKKARAKKFPESAWPAKLFLEAERLKAKSERVKAYRLYQKVYYSYPTSPEAERARAATVALREEEGQNAKKIFPYATFGQRKGRAEKLMKVFRYKEAAASLEKMLTIPYSENRKAEVYLMLGEAVRKSRDYPGAKEIYTKIIKRYPGSPMAVKSSYNIAVIDWNLDNNEECRKRLIKLVKQGVGRGTTRQAYFVLGKIAQSRKKYGKAAEYYHKALKLRPPAELAEELRWRIGWIEYNRKNFKKAAGLFAKAGKRVRPGEGDGKEIYWKIRSLVNAGFPEKTGASAAALTSRFGHTYYGGALASGPALFKPAAWTGGENMAEHVSDAPPPGLKLSDKAMLHYRRYKALLELNRPDRAALESAALEGMLRKKLDALMWLGRLHIAAGKAHKSIRLQNLALGVRKGRNDYDHPFWRLYYPVDHAGIIAREAAKRKVDPYLVYALIRQESAFDANALSTANARGLMQMIPSTAQRVYNSIGLNKGRGEPFRPEILFDPETNIILGVAHLAKLLKRYNGSVTNVLAAYNAGRRAVDSWLKRYEPEPFDEFVENIPYPETREYVKKALRNRALYRIIYGEDFSGSAGGGVVQYGIDQKRKKSSDV